MFPRHPGLSSRSGTADPSDGSGSAVNWESVTCTRSLAANAVPPGLRGSGMIVCVARRSARRLARLAPAGVVGDGAPQAVRPPRLRAAQTGCATARDRSTSASRASTACHWTPTSRCLEPARARGRSSWSSTATVGRSAGSTTNLRTRARGAWPSAGSPCSHATARGFRASCGTPESRLADPVGCATGWLRLDDVRYEVRDAQWMAGLLVDQGIADPTPHRCLRRLLRRRAFAHARAAARPGDAAACRRGGSYAPWRSPGGTSMELRAAAPYQTWSDLPTALAPNGRSLDYTVPRAHGVRRAVGSIKASFVAGLYATGQVAVPTGQIHGYYAPPGADPDANLSVWLPGCSPASRSRATRWWPTSSTSSSPTTPRCGSRSIASPRRFCSPAAAPTICSRRWRCCGSATSSSRSSRARRSACRSATSATSAGPTRRPTSRPASSASSRGWTSTCAGLARCRPAGSRCGRRSAPATGRRSGPSSPTAGLRCTRVRCGAPLPERRP